MPFGFVLKDCPECGSVGPVSHFAERFSARIDPILNAITKPLEFFWVLVRPIVYALRVEFFCTYLFRFTAAIGLGTIITKPDEKNNWRARVLWEEAEHRGITMREFRLFGLSREVFWATYNGETRQFDGLPRPRYASDSSLDWMDDKGIILKKFSAAGIPVPRGGACSSLEEAEKIFAMIRRETNDSAVVVKPNLGSRSRHTYVGITDVASLRRAFLKAKELTPWPVVEEELQGYVFRITLVGGKIAGVMRREPPHVIGDGKHTVRELVARENQNPLRHGPIFHEIPMDDESIATLESQKLSFDSVPVAGRMIILNEKVSRSYGASTTEFDDDAIHPDNRELFLKIGRVLNDALVGVDIMIDDVGKSWREQPKCGVIECNSLPFIDLHAFPLVGKPRNVAALVWDLIFPSSRRSAQSNPQPIAKTPRAALPHRHPSHAKTDGSLE